MKTINNALVLALGMGLLAGLAPAQAADFNRLPRCMNGADDDGDGQTDFPNDPGCNAGNDDDETNLNFSPQIKARIAIIFDTSGSLLYNVCFGPDQGGNPSGYTSGDGTVECPGNDVACCSGGCGDDPHNRCTSSTCGNSRSDDSRLAKLKVGLSGAVAAYGEVEYSLFRFHQSSTGFLCPVGGWRGGCREGQDGCADERECNPGRPFSGADQLVRFAPDNAESILMWLDGTDNWNGQGTPPAGQDFELRGDGNTNLAGSMDSIRPVLTAIKNADPFGSCRPYRVILVTDGAETCNGDPPDAAADLRAAGFPVYAVGFAQGPDIDELNDIAEQGGTGQAFFADESDELAAAITEIVQETVLIEVCDGLDNDCDTEVDEDFNVGDVCDNGLKGACFRQGAFICTPNKLGTVCNAPTVQPGNELDHGCNGIDDDCDGLIDDGLQCSGCTPEICNGRDDDCDQIEDNGPMPGVGAECGINQGECHVGHVVCRDGRLECEGNTTPMPEICDGKDNNCDGVVDQLTRQCYDFPTGCVDTNPDPNTSDYQCMGRCIPGFQTCTAQTQPNYGDCIGELGPTAELCNTVDDNCNGLIDEDFPLLGQTCERGQGLCHTTGHFICSPDGTGVVCDANVVTGVTERCNGVDDDCDGTVDDLGMPPPPPIGQPCGSCGGHFECQNGQTICTGGGALPEICNNKDDNCDGLVDNGDLPGEGESCVPEDPPGTPLFMVTGACRPGTTICVAGAFACVNYTGPQPEICDNIDNDCDGMVDDMASCPDSTNRCVEGSCVIRCGTGEFPCPTGFTCRDIDDGRFCIPNPCVGVTCPEGQICNPDNGTCADPCEGVNCPTSTTCRGGRCVDCFTTGCPAGTTCIRPQGSQFGMCQSNPCMGVTCPEGQTCNGGTCTEVACAPACIVGQVCDRGQCVSACAANLCAGANCGAGMICQPSTGSCISDPCLATNCSPNGTCSVSCDGKASCLVAAGVDVLATGGGGCTCEIGASAESPAPLGGVLLGLLGLMFVWRRRR